METVVFFRTPAELRSWFAKNHRAASELWIGFHKVGSGRPSVTWPQSVDEALCVGWIDGVRKRIDEHSYKIRFTPRKPVSTWSAINIARMEALAGEGRLKAAGKKAFAARRENRSGIYAYEQRAPEMVEPYRGMMEKKPVAWKFFQAQPPSYRKVMTWWVVSAKREETRLARVAKLIAECAAGRRMR